jgi:membrane protease YdiL (CAAX protease family)
MHHSNGKRTTLLLLELLAFSSTLLLVKPFISLIAKALGDQGLVNSLLFGLLLGLVTAVLVYVIGKIQRNWTWQDLGFKIYRGWAKDIWLGVIFFGVSYLVDMPLALLSLPSQASSTGRQMGTLPSMPLPALLLVIAGGALIFGFFTGAFHQEIRLRGYMQSLFSREVGPMTGMSLSLVAFILGDFLSHPDWDFYSILNLLPIGIVLCVGYYATGSLLVVMTTHMLSNLQVPAFILYATGHIPSAYLVLVLLGVISLAICYLGWKDFQDVAAKMRGLFSPSGIKASLMGIALGLIYMLSNWGWNSLKSRFDETAYFVTLAIFSTILFIVLLLSKRRTSA